MKRGNNMRFPEEMKKGKKIEQVKWRKKLGSCLEENRRTGREREMN